MAKKKGYFLWIGEDFMDPDAIPNWTQFRRIPTFVDAVQMDDPFEVNQPDGVQLGDKGDWLVRDTDGNLWPIDDTSFKKFYEEVIE